MHRILCVCLIFQLIACTNTKESNHHHKIENKSLSDAQKLLKKSIAYHDPNGNWEKFQSKVNVESELRTEEQPQFSTRTIYFDNPNDHFALDWSSKGINIHGELSSDTCYAEALESLTEEQAKSIERSLGCKGISMYKDYYHYLLGIPMKLMEEKAIVNDSILARNHDGIAYEVVKVNYEPLDSSPAWYFYFDKRDHSLRLCKFTSAEDETKGGEYILYEGESVFFDIKFKRKHIWLYNTPERDTLAIESYEFY